MIFTYLMWLFAALFIVTGLSGALSFAVSVYDRARDDPEQSEMVALKAHLRSWLSNASPPSGIYPYPVEFIGEATRLEFTTTYAKGFASNAAALRVLIEDDGGDLVMTIAEMHDDGDVMTRFWTH